jgi:Peptidase family M28
VVGAHLDSVGVGVGINDNGSGSAAILEIAEQLAGVGVRNKLRFIWFSAEESGLLGSEAYAASLPDSERDKIAAMLNFDMVGSPNFVRFVYDGDLSDSEPPEGGAPEGSAQIEDMFLDYFASQGLATEPTAFDGRSDYGPFISAGIPAGGSLHGRRGDQDGGGGGGVRRFRGPAVRPVLPPRLRRPAEPEQPSARPDERCRGARDHHAGDEHRVHRWRAPQQRLRPVRVPGSTPAEGHRLSRGARFIRSAERGLGWGAWARRGQVRRRRAA